MDIDVLECDEHPGRWRAQGWDSVEGDWHQAEFSGHCAEMLAREYALWKLQHPHEPGDA